MFLERVSLTPIKRLSHYSEIYAADSKWNKDCQSR